MQGMMLAERPQDTSISSGMIGSSPSVSIGNYKGVMLCNRPFAGVQAAAQHQASGGPAKAAFVCGNVPSAIGAGGRRSDLSLVKRTKKETALTRHRKWLAELQRTKVELEKNYLEELHQKEESKKRFMAREARMRALVTQANAAEPKAEEAAAATGGALAAMAAAKDAAEFDGKAGPLEGKEEESPKASAEEHPAAGAEDKLSSAAEGDAAVALAAAEKRREKQGKVSRPMWALTEDKAHEASEKKEEDDAMELLAFAQNLDFEKYIDDMEIQTMMDQVKARIGELEIMADEEYEASEVRGEARPHTLTAEKIAQLQAKYGVSVDEDKDEDTMSVASRVLSENKGLGAVHSQKSVAAITAKKMEAISEEPKSSAVPEPRIVSHPDDEGTRLANKSTIQKLPYMNRNPSV